MPDLFLVLIEDRHTDPEPHIFTDREQAISYARERAEDYNIDPEDEELGEAWHENADFFLSIVCTHEGDSILVYEVEVTAPPTPPAPTEL
jgi:hypothetical protein